MSDNEFDNQFVWADGLMDNEQFRSLVNHIPGAIYRCLGDQWLSLEFFSNEIVRLTGYPMEYFGENKKDGYQRIVHPDDLETLLKKMHNAIHEKEKFELEYRIIRKDGELRWVSERAQGVYEEENQMSYVDGCIFDITHHRRIQEALEKSEDEVKQLAQRRNLSQKQQAALLERLTLATNSAEIGIWEIDLITNKVIWDQRMFNMYGYPNGTDKSLYKVFSDSMHPKDAAMMTAVIGDLITGKKELNGAIYRIILPDGSTRYIESHAIIKKSETGQPISLIGTNRDATEDVLVQEKIKAQNKILREIAFIQSHEVRKPLANILGMIDILKNNGDINKEKIIYYLEESAKELDNEIRNIVSKTNSLNEEATKEVEKLLQ